MGLLVIQCLKSELNPSFKKSTIDGLVFEIQNVEPLPSKFCTLYSQIHPIISTPRIFFNWTIGNYKENCPCLEVASFMRDLTMSNSQIIGNRYVLALKLEKELNQGQCLNYWTSRYDFLNNIIGINKASEFYFQTELDSLSDAQMAFLIILMGNPSYNNPMRYPPRLEEQIKKLSDKGII